MSVYTLWRVRALSLALLNFWLFPPWVALAIAAVLWWFPLYVQPAAIAILLLPSITLALAIVESMLMKSNKLPHWAWAFDTPDSPTSPYSDFEPTAKSYYACGRFIGDYLWFAWRNLWYGLAFHWGAGIDPDRFNLVADGNPRVGDTAEYDGTGAFVYGTVTLTVIDRMSGRVAAFGTKTARKFGPFMWIRATGWKDLQGFWHWKKEDWPMVGITSPAMIADGLPRFRKAK